MQCTNVVSESCARLTMNVRYSETDQMGIVHHSNYLVWFEEGRKSFFDKLGVSIIAIESSGAKLLVHDFKCHCIKPARFEDDICIRTYLKSMTKTRLTFTYEVYKNECSVLIAQGETVHFWTDNGLKPINANKVLPEVYKKLVNMVK